MDSLQKLKSTNNILIGILVSLLLLIGIIFPSNSVGFIIAYPFRYLFGNSYIILFVSVIIFIFTKLFCKNSKLKGTLIFVLFLVGFVGYLMLCANAIRLISFVHNIKSAVSCYNSVFAAIKDETLATMDFGLLIENAGFLGTFLFSLFCYNINTPTAFAISVVLMSSLLLVVFNYIAFLVKKYKKDKSIEVENDEEEVDSIEEFDEDFMNDFVNIADEPFVGNADISNKPKPVIFDDPFEAPIDAPKKEEKQAKAFNVFADDIFSEEELKIEEAFNQEPTEFNVFNDDLFGETKKEQKAEEQDPNEVITEEEPVEEDVFEEKDTSYELFEDNDSASYQQNFIKNEETEFVPEISEEIEEDEELKEEFVEEEQEKEIVYNYKLPPISLLDDAPYNDISENQMQAEMKAIQLNAKLKSLNINGKVVNYKVAPAFTRFEVQVENDVKINQIPSVKNDLMMALSATKINVLAPIPGTNYVGIDIPNVKRSIVTFKECFTAIPFADRENKLIVPIGKDITGQVINVSLDDAPHMLVAGATGTGKSVCLNSILIALCMRAYPSEVGIMIIDPKKVEFTPYQVIPHLVCPVITDLKKATVAIKKLCEEMDKRYQMFAEVGVKNIKSYNKRAENNNLPKLKSIVCLIDEFGDLITTEKNVEDNIRRLTSLARAAGIILIIATQRPSVDVITGTIKTNIPSRIAFAVAGNTESRIILDEGGAEDLLGRGDLLLKFSGRLVTERIQGSFLDDHEIEGVTEYLGKQAPHNYMKEFLDLEEKQPEQIRFEELAESEEEGIDELYPTVIDYLRNCEIISVTQLRRKFGMGQIRAGRMIDKLEADGYISGQLGPTKPRNVYKNRLPDKEENVEDNKIDDLPF